MPSHEQGYESITKKGLPVFTVKLEVSYTIATSPQKPVPQKTLIRESSVLDDPEEEWILSLAILLEEKNPHNVVMIKEGDNYILSGTIDTIPFNLFIAEDLSIIRDGSEIVGIHKDLIIS